MSSFEDLVEIVATLRGENGCPWDKAQNPESMRPYILEEAHEVLDAIDGGDSEQIKKELGDLLFQIVLLAQMKSEEGIFDVHDICRTIADKMVSRHPHVFDPQHVSKDNEGSIEAWEARKSKERGNKTSMMDGIPKGLPSLLRAHRVGEKVSGIGFDWPNLDGVRDKLQEELDELDEAIHSNNPDEINAEYGDVLLSVANMGRFLSTDPETALRMANERFSARFRHVEALAKERGLSLHAMNIQELEHLWQDAKKHLEERSSNRSSTQGTP